MWERPCVAIGLQRRINAKIDVAAISQADVSLLNIDSSAQVQRRPPADDHPAITRYFTQQLPFARPPCSHASTCLPSRSAHTGASEYAEPVTGSSFTPRWGRTSG